MSTEIWFNDKGTKSIRWALVAATAFYENVESNVSQRDHGKHAYPDKPCFVADGMHCYYDEALSALKAFRAYYNLPDERTEKT